MPADRSAISPAAAPEAPVIDDQITVTSRRIACDGGGGALGHPRVWLDMGQDETVICKYCGRLFQLDPSAKAHAH